MFDYVFTLKLRFIAEAYTSFKEPSLKFYLRQSLVVNRQINSPTAFV